MFRHFPKLLYTIAAIFGMYLLINGFASKTASKSAFQSEEKCEDSKPSSQISIKKLGRHFLDFNR